MKIIITRHAQTDENIEGKLALRTEEVLLNEEGLRQAEKLGEHLKGHTISHAYSSPLKRAVATAEAVLRRHPGAQLVEVEDLLEQNLGAAQTMPKAEWREIRKQSKEPWHLFKAEKGESYQELQGRVKAFFHDLIKRHQSDDTVLLVSHGGPLGVLLVDILEKELTEENYKASQPKNTEFTILEISPDGFKKIHVVNNNEHLN